VDCSLQRLSQPQQSARLQRSAFPSPRLLLTLSCYTNADGDCIPEPASASTAPKGATAHCNDGDWSSSDHIRGTCSGHGGVDYWITRPLS
jgi:hypothetical protein